VSRRARRSLGVAAALAAFSLAPPARAATCGRPEVLDTFPPDESTVPAQTTVPPNGSLFAHYSPEAEYGNENVLFTPPNSSDAQGFAANDMNPHVSWDGTQGLLTFTPPARLDPGTYTLVWPALRGLNTASPSQPKTITFTAGTADDVAPPDFAGLTGVTWDLERQTNDCTKSLENRLVFTLSLAPADDDGGRSNLRLKVFQSSGSGVDGGPVPVTMMPLPPEGKPATVKLSVGEATGHVCFAAIVLDLTDKVSDSGSQTVCVDTTAPPFFRGCALAAGGGAGGAGTLAFILVALVIARRRSRAA
jgi:hypothetical protein